MKHPELSYFFIGSCEILFRKIMISFYVSTFRPSLLQFYTDKY